MKIEIFKPKELRENLAQRAGRIKKILARPKLYTCIEISEEYIKLAQFEEAPSGKQLVNLFTRKIPSSEEEKIIATLQAVLSEIKNKGIVLSCLPRHQVTVHYLKLPSTRPPELEAMLDFQVTKQIPYPKEEIVYSYTVLGSDASGYAKLLLAIVHRETVFQHLRLLKACGLEPEKINFNALAICEWFFYTISKFTDAILFIDIDTVYTKIGVISPEGLIFTRAVKLGVVDFEKEEPTQAIRDLEEEVRLSFSTYVKEYPEATLNKIILTGAVAVLERIKKSLEKALEMEIEIRLPLEKITVKKDVLEKDWFDMYRVSLNAVLGLGLERETAVKLNLLPASEKERRLAEQKRHQFVFSIILICLIALTISGFIYKKFYEKVSLVRYLNSEIKKINIKAQGLEEKKRNVELVREMFSDREISLNILIELHKIIPSEINLVSFDFEDRKGLTLRGTSTEMATVFRLVAILDKSPYFSNSQVKFVRKRIGTENLTDFEIFSPLKIKSE